jgi:hypothetical protein
MLIGDSIKMRRLRSRKLLAGGLCLTLLSACSTVGLGDVPQNRENYNKALDSSENEQFLMNVVRMHYGENPYFVGVDSITAATSLTAAVRGTFGVNNAWAPINGVQWSVSPQIAFSQTPTVTYSPVQGGKFATGMLAPLTLDKIYLLLQSGYNIKEVLKLTTTRIGNLSNGRSSHYVASKSVPNTSNFDNFINTLDELVDTNQVSTEFTSYESHPAVFLYATTEYGAKTLAQGLKLSKPYQKLIFANTLVIDKSQPENVISISTRSFFNVMAFLSNNVDTPAVDRTESENYNATLVDSSLDWSKYTSNMLHVRESSSEPSDAVAQVEYDKHWYYISDDDELSKSTLVLLKLIYSLQSGDVQANLPLITIPIN